MKRIAFAVTALSFGSFAVTPALSPKFQSPAGTQSWGERSPRAYGAADERDAMSASHRPGRLGRIRASPRLFRALRRSLCSENAVSGVCALQRKRRQWRLSCRRGPMSACPRTGRAAKPTGGGRSERGGPAGARRRSSHAPPGRGDDPIGDLTSTVSSSRGRSPSRRGARGRASAARPGRRLRGRRALRPGLLLRE